MSSSASHGKEESLEAAVCAEGERADSSEGADAGEGYVDGGGDAEGDGGDDVPVENPRHLVKLSYHDSGIDIRDPLLHVTPTTAKKVCSFIDNFCLMLATIVWHTKVDSENTR